MNETEQKLSVVLPEDSAFEDAGLRAQFVYRDLGIGDATGGNYHAHIIKAKTADGPKIGLHRHGKIDFQLVYILKGWMRFWYEGRGETVAPAGTCILQPPRHPARRARMVRRPRTAGSHIAPRFHHRGAGGRGGGIGPSLDTALARLLGMRMTCSFHNPSLTLSSGEAAYRRARYAVVRMLSRSATSSRQRARFGRPSTTAISMNLAKSTVHQAVMSATVNRSPAR